MAAMVNKNPGISIIFSLTQEAFCIRSVGLLCRGSQARSWTPYFSNLRGSRPGSQFLEDYRMVLDTRTFQSGGNILRQDICRVVPTQTCSNQGL